MNRSFLKNRRVYALTLLAALALLQIRVAFAACEMAPPHNAVGSVAACCIEHDSTMAAQAVDQMVAPCVGMTCAGQASAPQADPGALLSSQMPSFEHAPPLSAAIWLAPDAGLRLSAAQAHSAHTPLIYVLQRLLI